MSHQAPFQVILGIVLVIALAVGTRLHKQCKCYDHSYCEYCL